MDKSATLDAGLSAVTEMDTAAMQLHWRRAVSLLQFAATLSAVFGLPAAVFAAPEFHYKIPDGWVDLRNAGPNVDEIPMPLLREATSSRFAMFAVDPKGTTARRTGATLNAVEVPTAGRITKEIAVQAGAELGRQLVAGGFEFQLIESSLVKIDGVDSAVTIADIGGAEGTRRLMQYLISGHKISTVLSFAAPREDFDRYKPVFEGAAQATRGAYSHGGINWGRSFVTGGVVGGAFALGYLVLGLARKRRDSSKQEGTPAPAAAPTPLRRASKYTWVCLACRNPVPIALDKCRCGAPRRA